MEGLYFSEFGPDFGAGYYDTGNCFFIGCCNNTVDTYSLFTAVVNISAKFWVKNEDENAVSLSGAVKTD